MGPVVYECHLDICGSQYYQQYVLILLPEKDVLFHRPVPTVQKLRDDALCSTTTSSGLIKRFKGLDTLLSTSKIYASLFIENSIAKNLLSHFRLLNVYKLQNTVGGNSSCKNLSISSSSLQMI